MIITKQMIRDKLYFKGPLTLNELMIVLNVEGDEIRSKLLVMLNALQNDEEAIYRPEFNTWGCTVVVTG